MNQRKIFATAFAGAFIGALGVVVFLFFWQSPLLLQYGLERAAWEEMRVLTVSAVIGVIVGFAVAYLPKTKPRAALIGSVALAICFGVLWLIPLLLPMGSAVRLAWEEMRVVVVGLLIGGIIGYCLRWGTKRTVDNKAT